MSDSYAFLDKDGISFFDEGAEIPGSDVDLMSFPCDDDRFPEMLGNVVRRARDVLADTPAGFARGALRLGDITLRAILEEKATLVRDGKAVCYDDLDFSRMNQLDYLPILLRIFGDHDVLLGDEDLAAANIRITPEIFCASYVLRMAFNTTRWVGGDGDLRDYYLMQAAATFGVLQSLLPVIDNSISDAVASSLRKMGARRSATSRWSRLDGAKELAFMRRKELATLSRSAAIDKFLPEVVEACRAAGEPLTGGDPKRTVTEWFRKAGIK